MNVIFIDKRVLNSTLIGCFNVILLMTDAKTREYTKLGTKTREVMQHDRNFVRKKNNWLGLVLLHIVSSLRMMKTVK
jgi:hypothetical protein